MAEPNKQQNQGQQGQPPKAPPVQTPQDKFADQMAALVQSEKFLTDHGWTKAGTFDDGRTTWNDPLGSHEAKPEKKISFENILPDGGKETTYQTVGPLLPWIYSRHEAELIQRLRNEAPERARQKEAERRRNIEQMETEQAKKKAG